MKISNFENYKSAFLSTLAYKNRLNQNFCFGPYNINSKFQVDILQTVLKDLRYILKLIFAESRLKFASMTTLTYIGQYFRKIVCVWYDWQKCKWSHFHFTFLINCVSMSFARSALISLQCFLYTANHNLKIEYLYCVSHSELERYTSKINDYYF